eukprot:GEMP01097360.1.p1 GENE.GEMP01097360.1~~GEMP01097360.1.p1  ORF type:complete len:176 (+),score=4.02 GEMP01097360.1:58-585(+)
MCAMNTCFIPKKNEKKNLITWTSPDEKTQKQIDYISISKEQKNWVKCIKYHDSANGRDNKQHRILEMRIQIRYSKKYNEHSNHIDYNLRGLQDNMDTLKNELEKHDTTNLLRIKENENDKQRARRIWNETSRLIRRNIKMIHPQIKGKKEKENKEESSEKGNLLKENKILQGKKN